jgi:serine protease AprX
MTSRKSLRLAFLGMLIISIVVLGIFLSSSRSAARVGQLTPANWQDKVDASVLSKAALGQTEFFVHMAQQADLSGAYALNTKAEKGQYVFQRMNSMAESTQPPVRQALQLAGAQYKTFWVSNGIWAKGNLAAIQAVAVLPEVAYVYPSGGGSLKLPPQEEIAPQEQSPSTPDLVNADPNPEANLTRVNADDVWAMGYLGQGAVVAGADTGVRWTHSAVKNQYRGWNGATADHNYNWHDGIHNPNAACPGSGVEPCDDDTLLGGGHGTHTVGTMIGDDGGNNRIGMAPQAKWIACRNMNNGAGVIPTYMECMEWFIAPTNLANANPDPSKAPDAINNSWGCVEGCPPPALQMTLQASRAAGIFYAVSAGNEGNANMTGIGPDVLVCNSIQFPLARYPESFTVGATSHVNDLIADFSSRGSVQGEPTAPTGLMKPNISAPGVGVRSSLRGSDTTYGSLSGTSMAGPHVAGLVALLISANPRLAGKVDRLEDIIEQTAAKKTTTEGCGGDSSTQVPNNTYGWGRIDALTAVIEALPPIAVDDTATTTQNIPVIIEVLANDSDPDGDTLTVTEVTDPANGAAVINGDQTVTYTPDTGFTGIDTFTYTICAPEGCDTTSETADVTVTVTSTGVKINYALEVNGGAPLASSIHPSNSFPALAAINGDRTGANWGTITGGWNDGTRSTYPDMLGVVLPGTNGKTIDEIRVFTLQNNWTTAGEPNEFSPATGEGILDFIAQVCYGTCDVNNNTGWVTIPGGNVTGNDKAMRVFTFDPLTTGLNVRRIRVVVNNSRNNWSRIVELEAFGAGGQ